MSPLSGIVGRRAKSSGDNPLSPLFSDNRIVLDVDSLQRIDVISVLMLARERADVDSQFESRVRARCVP